MTRKAFELAGKPAGATTRTNDGFAWPDGLSVLMLDYDPPAGGDALGRGALVRSIREAAPGLADAAMLWWPSASVQRDKQDENPASIKMRTGGWRIVGRA